jgi:hypothetical protein
MTDLEQISERQLVAGKNRPADGVDGQVRAA